MSILRNAEELLVCQIAGRSIELNSPGVLDKQFFVSDRHHTQPVSDNNTRQQAVQ